MQGYGCLGDAFVIWSNTGSVSQHRPPNKSTKCMIDINGRTRGTNNRKVSTASHPTPSHQPLHLETKTALGVNFLTNHSNGSFPSLIFLTGEEPTSQVITSSYLMYSLHLAFRKTHSSAFCPDSWLLPFSLWRLLL